MPEPAAPPEITVPANVHGLVGVAQSSPSPTASNAAEVPIDTLLLRMRGGDRHAAAEFVMRFGSRIRRRIRGKLGPDIRRLFDSLDILSTLGRRLDLYVMSGRLQVASEAQLWNLLFRMADNALIDKARVFRRLQTVEGEDGEFAKQLSVRLREADDGSDKAVEIEIDNCMRMLNDPIDERILALWLTGEPLNTIASHVNLAPTAVRKRWEKVKARLRERLVPQET